MNHHSKLKYLLLLFVLVLVVFIYLFYTKIQNEKPSEILNPSSYEVGTKISLYKNAPPGFPTEILSQNTTLDYSGEVTNPSGKIQTTVSYISNSSMQDIVDIYSISLPQNEWNISLKLITASTNVAIIKASKDSRSILITIAPLKAEEMMVTIQYER